MKSKFKDYLLYTLSTVGVVALFISATTLPPQSSTVAESNEVGTYQIAGATQLWRVNTKTGDVVMIKMSNLDKINLNPRK